MLMGLLLVLLVLVEMRFLAGWPVSFQQELQVFHFFMQVLDLILKLGIVLFQVLGFL
jgi:hypothetical protein